MGKTPKTAVAPQLDGFSAFSAVAAQAAPRLRKKIDLNKTAVSGVPY